MQVNAALSNDRKNFYWNGDTSLYNPYYDGGHAVTIIGWDDNYSKTNFKYTPPYNGAFLVKNSWGTNWGDNGCFWVSYWDATFGGSELFCFNSLEPTDNYGDIYQYDPLGKVSSYGGKATMHGANVFVARKNDSLAAVGFYANAPNTKYTIKVYVGCTTSSPVSGTLRLTQTGTVEHCGYATIPLDDYVSISKGQRFSIVFRLNTPGYNYPLAFEAYYSYKSNGKTYWTPTSEATASAGESFISSDGTTWTDFTTVFPNGNLCLKAYTKSATPTKPVLSSIAISGVTALTSGQSAQFTCEVIYSDGSKKTVSPTWSIAHAGQAYAIVSASGLVTAKDVSAQQTVTVQASYTEEGVTKTATWGMYVTIAAPSAPTGVTATQGTEPSCVRVNWTAPSGATEYAVYRATVNNSKNAQYLENVTVPRYNDTSARPGVDYWYFIKAKNSSGMSGFSTSANGWRKLSPPDVTASNDLLDKVAVSWSEVEGAKYYRVYRATSMDGQKTALGSGWQTTTAFNDTTATAGVTYYYFVVAAVNASGARPSDYSIVEDGKRAEPVTISSLAISGATSIVSGGNATYSSTATYTDGHTGSVSPTWSMTSGSSYASVSGNRVTAAIVAANQTVTLRASYTESGKTVTGTKTITISAAVPAVPQNLTATASSSPQCVALAWSAVTGAASYKVYRGGVNVGTTSSTTYTDGTATPGVSYTYTVSAVNGAGESAQSSGVTATIPLAAPTGVIATSDRTDGVAVSWTAVNGATHYHVARATSASGTKTELGSWQAGTSYTDTTGTAGTTYYYFVRAATSSGGANASGYSAYATGKKLVPVTLSSIAISGSDKVSASKTSLYSCTATYSDGSTKTVSPAWSVSPSSAATIGASGLLTAAAVSANATARITATFTDGTTKTATKDVTIVAPIKATAGVQNVTVASRWPFSSLIDIDYELVTSPSGAKASVSVFGRDEDHGVDMAATSLTGDGANGSYIAAGRHRLTWNIGADYPNFHTTSFSVTMTATPSIIGVPENITVSASTSGVTLNWSAVEDADGYEVWRGTGTTTNGATRIAVVTDATTYFDGTGVAGTTYRYWLRASGEDGLGEFAQPITGTRALVVPVSLSISGSSSVAAGGTATYTCTVSRNDGTSGTVTPVWSITSGSSYASISSSGVLTANGTVTQLSVTIQASYTQNGTTKTATKTVTITPKTVTITFNANGGSVSPSSKTYTAGAPYGSLQTATRSGYAFAGWFTAASGGTHVSASSIAPSLDTTLYAHWTAKSSYGTYLVIDLSGGTSATSYPVTTLDAVPSDGWTDEYKTTKLVLRRIPAGTFTMGCEEGEVGYLGWEAKPHSVTISKPFYIGVFEVTQRQWELVMGNRPSYFENDSCYAMRPVECVTWNDIRGDSSVYDWPSTKAVDEASFMGVLRAKTGMVAFDLPTEAMWEYACRAGTTTMLNSGKNLTSTEYCPNMDVVGRYTNNNRPYSTEPFYGFERSDTADYGTAIVGSYQPNSWGLYDMHGNVNEWCLDWRMDRSEFSTDPVIDPVGPASAGSWVNRVRRGGDFDAFARSCTSAARHFSIPTYAYYDYGFRLCCSADDGFAEHDKVQLWAGGPYWATTNIGAEKPEDYGYYFWWGDTVGYKRENDKWVATDGSSSNYSFTESNTPTYNRSDATLQSEGWITADSVLVPAHDAAHVHWGGNCRMPTKQELDNLNSKCDWTWTTQNGVNGFIVRGRGDYASNSIFLPCAGGGYGASLSDSGSGGDYWSSVPYSDYRNLSWYLYFDSGSHYTYDYSRFLGQSVRPVQGFAN